MYRYVLSMMTGAWSYIEEILTASDECREGYGNYLTLNRAGTELVISNPCGCCIYNTTTQSKWE